MSTFIITRPLELGTKLQQQLSLKGIDSLLFPSIDILPLEPQPATIKLKTDFAVFVSRNAVKYGASLLEKGQATLAIGETTYKDLSNLGFTPVFMPNKPYTSEEFLAHPKLAINKEHNVTIIKGIGGRESLKQGLNQLAKSLTSVEVYKRVPSQPNIALVNEYLSLLQASCAGIIVNSIETLDNLLAITPSDYHSLLKEQEIITGSPRVVHALRSHNFLKPAKLALSAADTDILNTIKT